jgi:predicted nuclease with TOPRIM domain
VSLVAVDGIELTPELHQEYLELKREADELTFDEYNALKKERQLVDAKEDLVKLLMEQVQSLEEEHDRLRGESKKVRRSLRACKCRLKSQQDCALTYA